MMCTELWPHRSKRCITQFTIERVVYALDAARTRLASMVGMLNGNVLARGSTRPDSWALQPLAHQPRLRCAKTEKIVFDPWPT